MGRGTSTLITRLRHTSRRSTCLSHYGVRGSTSRDPSRSRRRSPNGWRGGKSSSERKRRRETNDETDAVGGVGRGRNTRGRGVLDARQAGVRRPGRDEIGDRKSVV